MNKKNQVIKGDKMNKKNQVIIGDIVKDRITGFAGVVIGITRWLTGCDTIGIIPQQVTNEGKYPEIQWLDTNRVIVIQSGNPCEVMPAVVVNGLPVLGGPQNSPQQTLKGC